MTNKNIQKVIAKCLGIPTKFDTYLKVFLIAFYALIAINMPASAYKNTGLIGVIVSTLVLSLLIYHTIKLLITEIEERRNVEQTCEPYADLANMTLAELEAYIQTKNSEYDTIIEEGRKTNEDYARAIAELEKARIQDSNLRITKEREIRQNLRIANDLVRYRRRHPES